MKTKVFFNKEKARNFVVNLAADKNATFNVAFKSFLKIKYVVVKYPLKNE